MNISKICIIVYLFLCCFLTQGFTQGTEQKNTSRQIHRSVLNQLIQESLAHNPEIISAKKKWEAAKKKIPQASALQDPTFGYAIMGEMIETRVGPEDSMYEVEQMIPFPGKLIERHRVAVAEARMAEAQLKSTELDVIRKVTDIYFDLYVTDVSIGLLDEIKEILKKMEDIAEARYASRQGLERDIAKAQVEISDTNQKMIILHQQRNTLVALLNSLLSRDATSDVLKIEDQEIAKLSKSLDDLLSMAKLNRPELQESSALIERDKHAKKLSQYEYIPDLSVGFQYVGIGAGTTDDPNDGRDAWMVPLKINIPLWQNRLRAGVLEAAANLESSIAKGDQIQNTTDYEVRDAYYKFSSAMQTVELYRSATIPQAESALRSDLAGYEGGKTDVLNVIDSERMLLNMKMSYYQTVGNALKSYSALERAVGGKIVDE